MQQGSSKVPFTLDNVSKCLCPGCPVQAQSKCVAGLKPGLAAALKNNPLRREQIPGVYCGAGKATCADIDAKKSCLCGGCAAFRQYTLAKGKPAGYFCSAGAAR
jgi:hypothetical protein